VVGARQWLHLTHAWQLIAIGHQAVIWHYCTIVFCHAMHFMVVFMFIFMLRGSPCLGLLPGVAALVMPQQCRA
jgi:hypothetical protein